MAKRLFLVAVVATLWGCKGGGLLSDRGRDKQAKATDMSRDAIETLGAVARAGGSLWGADYDLPVAGILTNGAAYFGACDWLTARPGIRPPLRRIEEGMRASRYGFGRQHRLRLVFTGRPPPVGLVREIARDPDARTVDGQALMG